MYIYRIFSLNEYEQDYKNDGYYSIDGSFGIMRKFRV